MEDDLNFIGRWKTNSIFLENGRRPQFFFENGGQPQFFEIGRSPQSFENGRRHNFFWKWNLIFLKGKMT
jgi:hypothetical protein